MDNILDFLEKNKFIIKKSWLEFYKENNIFFDKILENELNRVKTPDGGYRVKTEWILGFLLGKYSKFNKMVYMLYIASDDLEKIIEILGLNFDANKELPKFQHEFKKTSVEGETDKPQNESQNSRVKDETDKTKSSEIKPLFSELEEGLKSIFPFS